MSFKNKSALGEGGVYYPLSGGVDFSCGSECDRNRLANLENMYRDYEADGGRSLRSVPGFRRLFSANARINGIFHQHLADGNRYILVHSGTILYRAAINEENVLSSTSVATTLKNTKSRAFTVGYDVYVLDGSKIVKIDKDGNATTVSGANAYTPTLYYNAEPYEQRNFLTDSFVEKTTIVSPDELGFGSHGMYYRITDSQKKLCAVCATNEAFTAENITIPSYTTIEGVRYKVVGIDDNALKSNTTMKNLVIGEGITDIGKFAFCGCTRLEKVYCPETLSEIGDGAFKDCTSLNSLYLGCNLIRLGNDALYGCTALKTVYYTGNLDSFSSIENYTGIGQAKLESYSGLHSLTMEIPVMCGAKKINSLFIGKDPYSYECVYSGTTVTSVLVSVTDKRPLSGLTLSISGTLESKGEYDDFLPTEKTGQSAIMGCTVCEVFDGRIFLSGNPACPNTVFYSAADSTGVNNPTYFGVYNRFSDGLSASAVISLLGIGDLLAVFKSENATDGGIYYHTTLETNDPIVPKVYPVSYINHGIGAIGDSISFYDDPVFLCEGGLMGIEKRSASPDRSISTRSHNVNPKLLTENLGQAHLAKWCGYLAVAAGDKIYLADSRATFVHKSGAREYEWYMLSGVGVYHGTRSTVYRYASIARAGFSVHPCADKVVDAEIFSTKVNGSTYYYTQEGNIRYLVHQTEQKSGGSLSKISALSSFGERLLFFGTSDGDVCVFNNDKRGTPPPFISNKEDFDPEEYKRDLGGVIHPYFYSFYDVAPRYVATTGLDDCSVPGLRKSSVKKSLTLKCVTSGLGRLCCEVMTDTGGYREALELPNAQIDFSCIDFANLAFSCADTFSVPVAEKEKNWTQKQISVCSSEFQSPIGIIAISYRYTVKGKIKSN